MNREAVALWMKESWELWYWAMFCPSRLQQRMNEWCPAKDEDGERPDTKFEDILLFNFNGRFFLQFLQIFCYFSLPLLFAIPLKGQISDCFFLPIILLVTYITGLCSLPLSFHIPFLFSVIYIAEPIGSYFNEAMVRMSPINAVGLGWSVSSAGLILTIILWGKYIEKQQISIARTLLTIGSIISVLSGCWIASQELFSTLAASAFVGLILFFGRKFFTLDNIEFVEKEKPLKNLQLQGLRDLYPNDVPSIVKVVAFGASFGYALSQLLVDQLIDSFFLFIAAVIVTSMLIWFLSTFSLFVIVIVAVFTVKFVFEFILVAISNLSLGWILLACWLVSTSFYSNRQARTALLIVGIFVALGVRNHGWTVITVIPVFFAGYYRIADLFFFEFLIEPLIPTLLGLRRHIPNSIQKLKCLPPFTSELLWFPITYHDRLLVAAFRENQSEALSIFQFIRDQPLYGFQNTIDRALPQIIANQLATVNTIPELIATTKDYHPTLPILFPSLYQTEAEIQAAEIFFNFHKLTNNDFEALIRADPISLLERIYYQLTLLKLRGLVNQIQIPKAAEILPNFYKTAQNVEAAMQAGSIALRERSLERIHDQLPLLRTQLSGLVKPKAIKRWQTVIDRWQIVIQAELDRQRQDSQGEILNPFQYGNPLPFTRDLSQLFKGRTTFADAIVRQILDRNRPTIVLHGPRRCGKSSFLINLPRLLPSDVLPIYIDLQNPAASQSEADFCYTLSRAIVRDARSQLIDLPQIPTRAEFSQSPYTNLEDWLDIALDSIGDRRILLNIDEFEAIGKAIEQGRLSTSLFDQLRNLIQHRDRLSFLFSGVQTLDELGPNWSNYFISVMPIEMTYLKENEARELLLDPDPDFTLKYETNIVEEILQLTRCHPYLLQLVGWVLVQQANETQTKIVTPQQLQKAIPDVFNNGLGYFTNVWEQFTGNSQDEITTGQQILLALAQGQQPTVTDDLTRKSLHRMLRYHIIEKIGDRFSFEVPLIERWVSEKASQVL